MPVDGPLADIHGIGGFLVGHAAKKFEQDDPGALWMGAFKFFQRRIDQQDLFVLGSSGEIQIVKVETLLIASVLQARLAARVINQDPTHCLSRSAKKIGPVFPIPFPATPNQPKPGFMHEGGGLQSVAGRFVGHFCRRNMAKFLIYEWQQLFRGYGVARLRGIQNHRTLAHLVSSGSGSCGNGLARRRTYVIIYDFKAPGATIAGYCR